MLRNLIRAPRSLLLSGLMLAACGGAPEAELASPAEELLGTAEAPICSGASVSSLTILDISTYQGEMSGAGLWEVTYPANAVRLEFYIDDVLQATTEKSGSRSGSWNFSQSGVACGPRTFRVTAIPMVIDSEGSRTTCWTSGPQSLSQVVTEACAPTASLSCSFTSPIYDCTGSASGGTNPLTPMWRVSTRNNGSSTWQVGEWYDSTSWSGSFVCKPWSYSTRVEFRVRDAQGLYSNIRTSICSEVEPW
ncbi:MAG TPA: hypothetical protein VLQ93_09990 [Myxococcaceae bacterium]|nr:hypothetical protein [Myxococcaceae bacterium]